MESQFKIQYYAHDNCCGVSYVTIVTQTSGPLAPHHWEKALGFFVDNDPYYDVRKGLILILPVPVTEKQIAIDSLKNHWEVLAEDSRVVYFSSCDEKRN